MVFLLLDTIHVFLLNFWCFLLKLFLKIPPWTGYLYSNMSAFIKGVWQMLSSLYRMWGVEKFGNFISFFCMPGPPHMHTRSKGNVATGIGEIPGMPLFEGWEGFTVDGLLKCLFSPKRNDCSQFETSQLVGESNHPSPIKVNVCHPAGVLLIFFERLKHCHCLLQRRKLGKLTWR